MKLKYISSETIGCDLVDSFQSYLISKYSKNLKEDFDIEMEPMSNDEFYEEYGVYLTDAENKVLESISNFWEEEIG